MKKVLLFPLLLLFCLTLSAQEFNYSRDFPSLVKATADKGHSLYYPALLKRFLKCDTTLTPREVLAMMIGSTQEAEYLPYSFILSEREIIDQVFEGEYSDALRLCRDLLKKQPLNFTARVQLPFILSELGKKEESDLELSRTVLLLEAIFYSGDGTIERPLFVLGPADGQIIIRQVWSGSIGAMGSGSDLDGNFVDILEYNGGNGETRNTYFVIQHAVDKMFEPGLLEKLVGEGEPDDAFEDNKKKKKKRKQDK